MGEQKRELLAAQPAGQHEPGHPCVPARVVAAEVRVGSAVGLQALQRLHEQFGEVRFQVLIVVASLGSLSLARFRRTVLASPCTNRLAQA